MHTVYILLSESLDQVGILRFGVVKYRNHSSADSEVPLQILYTTNFKFDRTEENGRQVLQRQIIIFIHYLLF